MAGLGGRVCARSHQPGGRMGDAALVLTALIGHILACRSRANRFLAHRFRRGRTSASSRRGRNATGPRRTAMTAGLPGKRKFFREEGSPGASKPAVAGLLAAPGAISALRAGPWGIVAPGRGWLVRCFETRRRRQRRGRTPRCLPMGLRRSEGRLEGPARGTGKRYARMQSERTA